MASNMQQDADGQWRKSIPLPFYTRNVFGRCRYRCMECEHTFRTLQAYRDHYRPAHPNA